MPPRVQIRHLPIPFGCEDLFPRLVKHQVRFLVIGGLAMHHHFPARAPKDLDILLSPAVGNIQRLQSALRDMSLQIRDDQMIPLLNIGRRSQQIRFLDDRLDVVTVSDEMDFEFEWAVAEDASIAGMPAKIGSLLLLIHLKKESSRQVDIADMKLLRSA